MVRWHEAGVACCSPGKRRVAGAGTLALAVRVSWVSAVRAAAGGHGPLGPGRGGQRLSHPGGDAAHRRGRGAVRAGAVEPEPAPAVLAAVGPAAAGAVVLGVGGEAAGA